MFLTLLILVNLSGSHYEESIYRALLQRKLSRESLNRSWNLNGRRWEGLKKSKKIFDLKSYKQSMTDPKVGLRSFEPWSCVFYWTVFSVASHFSREGSLSIYFLSFSSFKLRQFSLHLKTSSNITFIFFHYQNIKDKNNNLNKRK